MTKSAIEMNKLNSILEEISGQCFFGIHGSYRLTVPKGWKSSVQENEDLHILFVLGGEGSYHMDDGVRIPLEKGSMVFVGSGRKHYADVNLTSPLQICGLRFGIYDGPGKNITKQVCQPFYTYLTLPGTEKYKRLLDEIHELNQEDATPLQRKLCNCLLFQLLANMYIDIQGAGSRMFDKKINIARKIVEETVLLNVPISAIAEKIGLSPRHFRDRFRQQYGISPKHYQVQVKMEHARYLIQTSHHRIREISEMLGYKDQYQFSREYKRFYGTTPSAEKL
jgi:AraC-like DNA-binding protein